jgi:hypothetical protein
MHALSLHCSNLQEVRLSSNLVICYMYTANIYHLLSTTKTIVKKVDHFLIQIKLIKSVTRSFGTEIPRCYALKYDYLAALLTL